ncbi:transcriptional regulator [Geodermatophilus sp. YIM 151500]|uniref:transcriptional regulator n=1 Tax=Geodermatophilus sp. YIM 151500 TaxID=2984531 RepID=UPI0021E49C86|nr:transcriptional regulator [Geodermatophilus sp. YIM 151500]MCV2491363.1 transcriptional regulator [Geodermatophilus sp. YIM 151500]
MVASGYGAARRWAVVAVLAGVLLALPSVVGALPASDADVPAPQLRADALASADVAFSGYAESAGGLTLPVGDRLSRLSDLVSDRTLMRVWDAGPDRRRVDVLAAGGETGYHADGAGGWVWEYEDARATRTAPSPLSLPTPPDLLPTSLGRRLLSEAADEELSRIGARRVAGRDALGLRLVPWAPAAAVERVDVWVDAASGLPLQVQVFGAADVPALDTRYLDLELGSPDPAVTSFVPPPGARVALDRERDLLEQADRRIARVPLPAELAGLPRRTIEGAPAAVGLYGRGVTLLAAVPVAGRLARDVAGTLRASPEAVDDGRGLRVAAGPLGLLVLDPPGEGAWLVAGTVTLDALAAAAAALPPPAEEG